MELRAFLNLFIRERNLVLTIVGVALLFGFLSYRLQEQWYVGEMLLSVTRQGSEATAEYQYDQFYHLQADERMADTVARYLETATGRHETAQRAQLSDEREHEYVQSDMTALRLSSNLVKVSYRAMTPIEVKRIADALGETGEQYIASLNERAASRNWFTLVASEPVARDGRFTLPVALAIGVLAGVFVAFWTVLGRWYWQGARVKSEN